MLTLFNQRWRDRRGAYRPASEVIDTRRYEVAPLDETPAKAFVTQHHYSGTYPSARFRFGLYRGRRLEGVAVFSHPAHDAVLTNVFGERPATELGRLVLLDEVPGNGESWMISRCFELVRKEGIDGIISHSDPFKYTDAAGVTVMGGHVGTVYQATNGVYLGRTRKRPVCVLPDGKVLAERAICKLKAAHKGEKGKGWRGVAKKLQSYGADAPGADVVGWADYWIPRLTRPAYHPGQHRYAWGLNRSARAGLPESLEYPKMEAA